MRIWVTRSQPGADRTAAALIEAGHQPVVQPLLEAQPIAGAELDLSGMDALAFTSGQAVTYFAQLTSRRDLPAFVTGAATAAAARAIGLTQVFSAEGDAGDLAELILTRRPGAIAWPRAVEPARDLAALLAAGGVMCRSKAIYRTTPAAGPPPCEIDGLLIHSAAAAKVVAERLTTEQAGALSLFAISAAAARPLESLSFARVAIASRPDETALLTLIPG